jgi:hypothetical protein
MKLVFDSRCEEAALRDPRESQTNTSYRVIDKDIFKMTPPPPLSPPHPLKKEERQM